MARPYWSGQIQISLVSFGVKLFPATEPKSEIHFHEISRTSGERIHHQKVSSTSEEPVEKDDIVKGYEYSKGEYIQLEPKEIEKLRIPSKRTLELQQFVELDEIDPSYLEKPYFVVPESDSQAEAFGVVRKALEDSGKAGLGKIAMGGREHVMALCAPKDKKFLGLMAYSLRFAEELRNPAKYLGDIKTGRIEQDSLSLAKELIEKKSARFDPGKFTDEYEAALRELVNAKLKNLPLPEEEKPKPRAKVINLMDALRRSVDSPAGAREEKKADSTGRSTSSKSSKTGSGKASEGKAGLRVIQGKGVSKGKSRGTEKRRKSA